MNEVLKEYSDQKLRDCLRAITQVKTLEKRYGIKTNAVEQDLSKKLTEQLCQLAPEKMMVKK